MADWERPLGALVDPPLAGPPSLADIEERARRHRTRRRVGSGAGAALAVVALIAGVVALNPSGEQTVHTASNSGDGGNVAGPALGPRQPFPESATVHEFDANGAHFRVVAMSQQAGEICLGLVSSLGNGESTVSPPCWTPDDRPIQAAAIMTEQVSYLFGIAAKSVTEVSLTATPVKADLFGQAAGYPVNFFGQVLPAGAGQVDLRALLGNQAPYLLSVTVHGRISSVSNGQQAAPVAPTTTVVRSELPGSSPPATPVPTTAAPPTTAPTVTSPPTTVPPLVGLPKLITITPGATELHRIRFESAVAASSNSIAVRYWAGVEPCTVLGKVDVVESADRVTVTLWIGSGNALVICTALAQYFETIVPLSAPLSARAIVDGAA